MSTRTKHTSWPATAVVLAGLFLAAAGAWPGPGAIRAQPAAVSGSASSRTPARSAPPAVCRPAPAAQTRLLEAYGRLPLSFEANRGQMDPRVKFLARGRGYRLFLTGSEAVLSLDTGVSPQRRRERGENERTARAAAMQPKRSGGASGIPENHRSAPRVGTGRAVSPSLPQYGGSDREVHSNPASSPEGRSGYGRGAAAGTESLPYRCAFGDWPCRPRAFPPVSPSAAPAMNPDVSPSGDPRGALRVSAVSPSANHAVLRMRLVGANPRAQVSGAEALPGTVNYFRGRDPGRWHTGIRTYARVRYAEVYPGTDLVYYGDQGQLEYDFVVRPGADPARIRLRFQGARRRRMDAAGVLRVRLAAGEIRLRKPLLYQQVAGVRQPLEGGYRLHGRNQVSFHVGVYDARRPLVIDPELVYSTYLGGSGDESVQGIAVDGAGSAYVTGSTTSSDFPTTAGAFDRTGNGGTDDTFVTKLDATGSALIYSTYLGGSGKDESRNIAVDAAGGAYVTGLTSSPDFPTTAGAFDRTYNGGPSDGIVTRLNPSGSALIYSTYLGGSGDDKCRGIAVDRAGSAYVAGTTTSPDFPTAAGAFDNTLRGAASAFITRLDATGSRLVYSTYLGGSGDDEAGWALAIDSAGNAYLAGNTDSADFPTTAGALRTTYSGGINDAFVTKMNATGSALLYSTYLGGSGDDKIRGLAVDGTGSAYVAGITASADFPTTPGAFDTTYNGGTHDAFTAKLNPAGSALLYSTYLGGSGDDEAGFALAIDGAGSACVTGWTTSPDFPTTPDAFDRTLGGTQDAFVTKLNPAGSSLLYSTYLGGSGIDQGLRIAMDGAGNIYVAGTTASADFPTANAYQGTLSGATDAFVAKIGTPPPTFTISGAVRLGNAGLPGVTVTAGRRSAVTDSSGAYQIPKLFAGTYDVTPSLAEYIFSPTSASVTVGPDQSGVDFTATRLTYSISGTVRAGDSGLPGVTVAAGGQSAATDAKGQYQIGGLISGDYTVTPLLAEYTFSPSSQDVTLGPSQSGIDFTATRSTYTISGTVREGASGLAGVTVKAGGQTAVTDGAGRYQIAGLISGSYPVTPSLAEYTFSPPSASLTLGPSQSGVDFTATRIAYTLSGTVRLGSAGLAGVTVSAGGRSATTDGNGAYQISGLISGNYTVTPSLAEYTFAPPSRSVTLGPSQSGVDFIATRITYTVSGTVRERFRPLAGVAVTLDGQTVITDNSGTYQFSGLISGSYTVSVSEHEYTFVPSSRSVALGPNQRGIDFNGLPGLPAPPSNLTVVAQSAVSVRLTWQDNSDNETGFKVERATGADGPAGGFTQIAILPANTTSYVDATVSGSTTYMYRVRAYNGGGDSSPSNAAAVTMPVGVLSITLSSSSVAGGRSVRGTVTLTGPAPGGAAVALSVSNGLFASVKPGKLVFRHGAKKGGFTVSTRAVIASTPVTVSASYNGSTAKSVLVITP